ncbi:MAG: hypothetical protein JWO59_3403 [Chloroflexi bacterium]|nr:hypothetical protein [Chloroflexota bacterium]
MRLPARRWFALACFLAAVPLLFEGLASSSQSEATSVYAVRTTLGPTGPVGSADTNNDNNITASRVTTGPTRVKVVSLSAFIGPTRPGDHFAVAIYADAGGVPGRLLAHSASTAVVGAGWNRAAISPTTLAPNSIYWLAYNSTGSADNLYYARSASGNNVWSGPTAFGSWPNSFPHVAGSGGGSFLIYATLINSHASPSKARATATNKAKIHKPAVSTRGISTTPTRTPAAGLQGCRFQRADMPLAVAFCDTFNTPAGTGNRSGDLNGMVWGTSRVNEDVNPGQGIFDAWWPTNRVTCGSSVQTRPEHDVAICNGQMVEATTDGDNFSVLAMYPTQPFDIAGRTGTVVFDVSADSAGPHAAWPSFVYTDQPIPAPYSNHPGIATFARNSFGFSLAASAPCGPGTTGLDEVFGTTDYRPRDLNVVPVDPCLTYRAGALNHFEVRISQDRVEIWGADAGQTRLKELGYIANAGLTLTRGLIWLEDVHYFADKFDSQGTHTFVWDNVGFDGPTLPRDLHLDVNDALTPNGNGSLNLGWYAPDPSNGTPLTLHVPDATHLAQASGALATLNFWPTDTSSLLYRMNGHAWHTLAWPYPDAHTYVWRTIALPLLVSELRAGTNTLDLKATKGGTTVANVDLILIGAQGVPVR